MENDSALKMRIQQAQEWLNEQVWFQQGKAKWDELDPNSKSYAKAGAVSLSALLLLFFAASTLWSIRALKNEIQEKQELLSLIRSANEELRSIRDQSPANASPTALSNTAPWTGFFETLITSAGIDKGNLTMSPEKSGTGTDTIKESLFDLTIKHVTLKQAVRVAYQLENGARPVKIRNLSIDTHNDPEGWMDLSLAVSGFYTPGK
jgi:hypothetical protein